MLSRNQAAVVALLVTCLSYVSTSKSAAAGLCSQTDILNVIAKTVDHVQTWYPEPCSKCTCLTFDHTEQCEREQCIAPPCLTGEMLTFDPASCCPNCSVPYGRCKLNGVTVEHGSRHRSSECEECVCKDGVVECRVLDCTQLHCSTTGQDACCAGCANSMCRDEGKLYPDMSSWGKGSCILCECNQGVKTCFSHICPPLDCQHSYTPEGACCPICANNQCWSDGALYQPGQKWEGASCKQCVCISGEPKCVINSCFHQDCPQNMISVKMEGECCPVCLAADGSCIDSEGTAHFSGQMWQMQGCQYCTCFDGKQLCGTVQCAVTECGPNEYLHQDEGSCCPVCKLKETCMYEGVLQTTKMWESWEVDPCKRCTCKDGEVQCYENACPNGRPKHGELHKGNNQFSYHELTAGLDYQHDGSAEPDDIVLLQASDFESMRNVLLPISVESSTELMLVNNATLQVLFGQQAMITSLNLFYEAGGDNKSHLIKYKITTQPLAGSVVMVVPQPEGSTLQAGWTSLTDGTMLKEMTDFRQTDISDGYVYYHHESSNEDVSTDSFVYEVKYEDGDSVLTSQIFAISVLPAEVFASPSVSAGSSLGLMAFEGETVNITSSHLSFVDTDTAPSEIVFTITQPLPIHEGFIEFSSSPEVPISRFTQRDINDGLLAYRTPSDLEVGLSQPTFSFKFNVTDDHEKAVLDQMFNILILPVNNKAPSVREGVRVNVERDGSVLINDALLGLTDLDTATEELEFTLISLPQHGDIVKLDQTFHTVIRTGYTYSYSEMLSDTLYYVHDNSLQLDDSFTIQFSDSVQSVEVEIPVTIQYSDMDSPTLSPGASMKLRLNEGEKKIITLAELEYMDMPSGGLVHYQLASEPRFGKLLFKTRLMQLADVFTQPDITSRRISYQAHSELGNLEIMDTIYFNISDNSGNMAAMQPFTVSIRATDNHPPIVSIGSDLVVDEGRRKQLTKAHISAQDPDSILTNLMIVIDSVPTIGTLKIITSDGLERGIRQSQVHKFLLSDLYAGIVYYDQNDHVNKEPRSDFFWFHISDGDNISPVARFNITISPKNDEPPSIISDTVFVEEGDTVPVTNSSIYVNDIDTEFDGSSYSAHVFTLTRLPREGNLQSDNGSVFRLGDSFTMEDILEERVFYSHHGREDISQDTFTVTVTDGFYEDTKRVPIDIALLDDETPRIKINDGLRVKAGGDAVVDSSVLHANDIDSDDEMLIYLVTHPVHRGLLYRLSDNGTEVNVTLFTPPDLRNGIIKYRNSKEINQGGLDFFKFDVIDLNENHLIGQVFYIDLLADTAAPMARVNSPLSVKENGFGPITTSHLYITDSKVGPHQLQIHIDSKPEFGNIVLEDDRKQAIVVSNFTMADIVASRVFYVHESEKEIVGDSFKFTATDGFNNVTQSFRIRIIQVDDSLPVITLGKLFAVEGKETALSEFDIKITDNDTRDESLLISLCTTPTHGIIMSKKDGNDEEGIAVNTMKFTMAEIYSGDIFYRHDNTESSSDSFSFTVTDQTNEEFYITRDGELIKTTSPLTMEISIQLLDDRMPRVVINRGISYLENNGRGQSTGKITSKNLKIEDADTEDDAVIIKLTRIPKFGILSKLPDVSPVSQFTQDDVNEGLIVYTLSEDVRETADSFEFSVMDSRPNSVSGLTFHVTWSFINLGAANVTSTEEGIIEILVYRTGALQEYATVDCDLYRAGGDDHYSSDITVLTPQIQFEKGDTTSMCRLSVVNDTIYEGAEDFKLKLSSLKMLLGEKFQTFITLTDVEDEPLIEFLRPELTFNESVGFALVPVVRSGDLSNSTTVLCSTVSQTAVGSRGNHLLSGTDFISRNDYVVRFEEGEKIANCDIRILDDTLYEVKEEFEVVLSDPSSPAKLKQQTTATVFIAGPNDVSTIRMESSEIRVYEDEGVVSVGIIRVGLDLSKPSTVWCTTKMISDNQQAATPSDDYVPISRKISFTAGQSKASCEISIVDDVAEPRLEGVESFAVTIISADSRSIVVEPSTTIVSIDDSDLDAPLLSFETARYTVNEDSGKISVPIVRTGDVTCTVSVICYTRQQTAAVMEDYQELTLTNASRIEILAGERSANCDLQITDDDIYETSEFLLLRLTDPLGCEAMIDDLDVSLISIQDSEDKPFISFAASSYSVREPISATDYTSVKIQVTRQGDSSLPAEVRVSTRDRSAVSSIDYTATSVILPFMPGERSKVAEISILYNPEVEWHESFMVVLEDFLGATGGDNKSAVINILDTDVAGSLVLPTVPIVVSLAAYESGKCTVVDEVSPGYPLICLSPCDPLYPLYADTEEICKSSHINSSAISYGWELSYPVQSNGKVSSYLKVSQATTFSRVDTQLLETFYFRAGFTVRCIATPIRPDGQTGVPIRSASVNVHSKGLCSNPVIPNSHGSLGAQSFTAKLDYVGPEAESSRANKIYISVDIPHQDGMLPLISTMPIYNIDYLLTQTSFTRQHVCSNLPNTSESVTNTDVNSFLSNNHYDVDNVPPMRVEEAVKLYKHLNRMTCRWSFEAWFDLSKVVNLCGGRVTRNFDVDSGSKSFVTVHQPLHVSYIFAKAPTGWASLDHQTMLEFSFYYDTVKFQSGVDLMKDPEASVDIIRVGIGEDGKLAIQMRSHSKFRGLLVTEHYTAAPGQTAQLVSPKSVDSKFILRHMWTQPTFDGPVQMWRATSRYSLQDYSGTYTLQLLACVATQSQSYNANSQDQKCAVQKMLSFPIEIAFQQTNRPVPAVYSLATQFQLTNSKRFFLIDPQTGDVGVDGEEFHGVFEKGERLFGRVFWDPNQDLESAFRIQLDKVFICAGRNGYAPTYDPTGKVYNEGAQYGCLEQSNKLEHRFLLLDRGQEDVTTKVFNGLSFKANFADTMPGLTEVNNMPGTDGFVMSVDPLFAATGGQQWHVHILYRIGSADSILQGRRKRAASESSYKVGTNLITINLNQNADKLVTSANDMIGNKEDKVVGERVVETRYVLSTTVIVILVVVAVLVVGLSIGTVAYVKHSTNRRGENTTAVVTQKREDNLLNDKLLPTYEQATSVPLSDKAIGTAV